MRLTGIREQLPPDETALRAIAEQRRKASEAMATDSNASFADKVSSVLSQMSGRPRVQSRGVRYRFGVSLETRDLWDDFVDCFHGVRGWLPPGTTPIRFLCVAFCVEWMHVLAAELKKYGHIYARDEFECQSPLCTRKDVTPHHLKFRSRGGGEEDENIITLCSWCHLFGVHLGLIRALPPASNVTWQMGRERLLTVIGRKKIDSAALEEAA